MIEKRIPLIALGLSLLVLGVWRIKNTSAVPSNKSLSQETNSQASENEGLLEALVKDTTLFNITSDSDNTLLLGDSQIAGKLGEVLESSIKFINPSVSINRLGIPGVSPKTLLSNADYKSQLDRALTRSSPDLIIIQLGDNGINSDKEALDLLNYIVQKTKGVSRIIWIGAHPKTIPMDKKTKLVLTSDLERDSVRYISNYNERVTQWNKRISNAITSLNEGSNIFFVDPFSMFPYKDYNMTKMSFDGVHILEQPARDFAALLFSRKFS